MRTGIYVYNHSITFKTDAQSITRHQCNEPDTVIPVNGGQIELTRGIYRILTNDDSPSPELAAINGSEGTDYETPNSSDKHPWPQPSAAFQTAFPNVTNDELVTFFGGTNR